MKNLNTKQTWRGIRKGLASLVLAGAAIFSGVFTANAVATPVFNGNSSDYPTLQVARPGQNWGTSTSANPGDIINLLVWDHNSAENTVAQNVKIKIALPSGVANTHSVSATLSANNAASVTGTIAVNASAETKLTYINNSAVFYRNVNGTMQQVGWPSTVTDPNAVVGAGIYLGDQIGCWQYSQAVLIQARVEGVSPAISTNKKVELAGGSETFGNTAVAQPGDAVNFKIYLENTGAGTGVNPRITDTLDSHLTYIPDSSYMIIKRNNQDYQVPLLDELINFNGQTITWAFENMAGTPDAALYLIFQARVAPAASFPVGTTVLENQATSSFDGVTAATNEVTISVTRNPDPVVNFSLRKEVTNLTLGDSKWYDEQYASASPGDELAYRLILTNTGNIPGNNVTLKDILPAGISFNGDVKLYNSQYPNGLVIPGNDIVNNGYVFAQVVNGTANAQTIVFRAKVTQDCSGNNTLTNWGLVIYDSTEKARDGATVTFTCTRGLIITKDILDPQDNQYKDVMTGFARESQVLSYRINVQNNGNAIVRLPKLRDILPAQVTYVYNSLAIDGEFMSAAIQSAFIASATDPNSGVILTDLNPGMGKVITFQVKINDCPPLGDQILTNTAMVGATGVAEISDTAKATLRVQVPVFTTF